MAYIDVLCTKIFDLLITFVLEIFLKKASSEIFCHEIFFMFS